MPTTTATRSDLSLPASLVVCVPARAGSLCGRFQCGNVVRLMWPLDCCRLAFYNNQQVLLVLLSGRCNCRCVSTSSQCVPASVDDTHSTTRFCWHAVSSIVPDAVAKKSQQAVHRRKGRARVVVNVHCHRPLLTCLDDCDVCRAWLCVRACVCAASLSVRTPVRARVA